MRLVKPAAVFAAAFLAIAGSAWAANPSAKQILANTDKAYASLHSLEAEGTAVESMSISGKTRSTKMTYHIVFQRPAKLRYDGSAGKSHTIMVSDGRNIYVLPGQSKYYQRAPLKGGVRQLASLGGAGVNTMALLAGVDVAKHAVSPKLVGHAKVAGVDCYIVQFKLASEGTASQKLWIGKKDWLVRKNELRLSAQAKHAGKTQNVVQTSTTTVQNIHPNASVKASAFVFKPPKGVKEFDAKKAAAEQMKRIEAVGDALHGKPAPAFSLKDTRGYKLAPASLKGKVVLVTFWASKNPPSTKLMPTLQKLYVADAKKGLSILAISLDSKGSDAESYAKKAHLTYHIFVSDSKTLHPIITSYKLVAVPTTYVVNRSGKIVSHLIGVPSESALKTAVDKAGL